MQNLFRPRHIRQTDRADQLGWNDVEARRPIREFANLLGKQDSFLSSGVIGRNFEIRGGLMGRAEPGMEGVQLFTRPPDYVLRRVYADA